MRCRVSLVVTLALGAALAFGCGDGATGTGDPSGSAAVSGAPPGAITTPTEGRAPLTTQGAGVALLPDESQLIVADEWASSQAARRT